MNFEENDDIEDNPDDKSDLTYKQLLQKELLKQIKDKIVKEDNSFKKTLKHFLDEKEK